MPLKPNVKFKIQQRNLFILFEYIRKHCEMCTRCCNEGFVRKTNKRQTENAE